MHTRDLLGFGEGVEGAEELQTIRAIYICKRALYIRKRALYICKRAPYICKRAPYIR